MAGGLQHDAIIFNEVATPGEPGNRSQSRAGKKIAKRNKAKRRRNLRFQVSKRKKPHRRV